jgi:EAL domain-containing protein (putative c-di-GMP-specific phosphodiesterase class I)/AmiR/NasT family two-component response regulator
MIADDEPLVRKALALTVASDPGLELVGSACDAEEAIQIARRLHPDVALVDVRMPGGGPRATREISTHCRGTRIIAFSAYSERAIALDMLRAGATAYVVKGSSADDVLDTIRRVARGDSVMSAEIAGSVLTELTSQLQREESQEARRAELSDRIHDVIDNQRFTIVFQPIVELASGHISGFEALARFHDEGAPERWFEQAERVGLRAGLELATARAAAEQIDRLPPDAYLSLNFAPDTLPLCYELVAGHPNRIVLEVTEHAAIEDYPPVISVLDDLRTLTARIAVDDAGAGFASLRHALQLSPDVLKLDVSLTRGIDGDSRRRALAAGLTGFARELGAAVVAEGVETQAELVTLRSLGASHAQGHHLAAPAPLPAHAIDPAGLA